MKLTFDILRKANLTRLPLFKNSKGLPAHSEPDGSDWKLSAWSNATLGELGELANLIKKVERNDYTFDELHEAIGKELADVQIYLDLLAYRCGHDLGHITIKKFNEVSDRVGVDVKITPVDPKVDELIEFFLNLSLETRNGSPTVKTITEYDRIDEIINRGKQAAEAMIIMQGEIYGLKQIAEILQKQNKFKRFLSLFRR